MKPLHISISISLLLISLSLFPINNATITNQSSRRILHQPLFPDGSTPPPDVPPPPPPDSPPPPDLPFFHQNPEVVGPTTPSSSPSPPSPDQTQPPPAIPNATTATSPATTPPATKKLAIAISVGIVTLGMLSALCFFLYRHKHRVKQSTSNHHHHHQKLVHGTNSHNDTEGPPSSYLYLGTVEPPTTISHSPSQQLGQQLGQQLSQQLSQRDEFINNNNNNNININDHNKVINIPAKRSSDRYRPSPELQPLPPLTKPLDGNFPPEVSTSSSSSPSPSPASENSDEESRGMAFHTPHGSAMSYEDGYFTPISRQSSLAHDSPAAPAPAPARGEGDSGGNSRPFSKRTSPRNRFTASSPDVRPVIIPSIKPAPPPPPPPPPPLVNSGTSRRPKFSAPPPAPNLMHLRSTAAPTAPPPPVAVGVPSSSSGSGKRQTWSERGGIKESNSCEHVDGDEMEGGKPKLKALHWDKVRATSDCATVWDQLKSSSFQLNEDMMESLFGFNSTNDAPKEPPRKLVVPPVVNQEDKVLDPKKSQNIAILLRALNVTRDEVCEALLDGNPEGLGTELFETLVKMAPTKEEEIKLKKYDGDLSKLGSAERFLKAVLDIPFAFKRVEALLYRANFDYEVNYLRKSFQTLEAASEELKNSRLFLKLLEAVLRSGNRMNVGTNRGDAKAFKLDTLLKLVDIKGTDGKTTLLHFVVQEIIRSEGMSGDSANENGQKQMNPKFNEDEFKKQGLQVVAGLGRDLGNVKKAATMDSDVLSSYVAKLESGLEKVRSVLQLEKPDTKGNFFNSMKLFLRDAGEEIVRIKEDERKALFRVKEVTEYFHGNAAKEEAHPFRIFMIVRDFLNILDQVCKEVGRMQDRVMVGAARSFRIASTASLPVLNKYHARQDRSSDEESSSP